MTGDANNAQPVPSFQSKAPVSVVFFIIIRFAYAGTLYQSGCPPSHSVLKVCNFGRYFFFFCLTRRKIVYIFIFQEICSFTELRAIVCRCPIPGTGRGKSVTVNPFIYGYFGSLFSN